MAVTDSKIHPAAALGPVALTVADLARALSFYQDILGLQPQAGPGGSVMLAPDGGAPIISLVEHRGAQPKPPRTTGLYHYAILLPTRRDLARVAQRLIATRWNVQGASDHGVSEALYLADPDGSGIEIYHDRPRDAWPQRDGSLEMVTEPLDFDGLMGTLAGDTAAWAGLPAGTRIGHIHLHVRDLREAEAFYTAALGLDLMQHYRGSAAFLSAGGYHHHVGINTWAGVGAPPPPDGAAGLRHFTLVLPTPAALEATIARLAAEGRPAEPLAEGFLVRDPSGNAIALRHPTP